MGKSGAISKARTMNAEEIPLRQKILSLSRSRGHCKGTNSIVIVYLWS